MNSHMISQSQAEQLQVEATQEYQIDQKMLRLDALLEKINALLRKSHEDDRAFSRYLRKQHIAQGECPKCGHDPRK